jgi:hypothetical protein
VSLLACEPSKIETPENLKSRGELHTNPICVINSESNQNYSEAMLTAFAFSIVDFFSAFLNSDFKSSRISHTSTWQILSRQLVDPSECAVKLCSCVPLVKG